MKKIFFFIVSIFFFLKANSQPPYIYKNSQGAKIRLMFILIQEGRSPIFCEHVILGQKGGKLVDFFPQSQSAELRKLLKLSEIISLQFDPGIKFSTLTDVFNQFKIQAAYQNLPVTIDDFQTDNPWSLLAQEGEIIKVEIVGTGTTQRINIVTKHPNFGKDKSGTYTIQ